MYQHICVILVEDKPRSIDQFLMDSLHSHFSNNSSNKLGEIPIENLKDYYEHRLLSMIT